MSLSGGLLPQQVVHADDSPSLGSCTVFPPTDVWNVPIDHLPVDANSDAYVHAIGGDKPLRANYGSGLWDGATIGMPYVVVPGSQKKVRVKFDYGEESDYASYPLPPDAQIEGGAKSQGDRHVMVIDKDHCVLYELYSAFPQPDGTWKAGSGAIFDLRSHGLRPLGWTSTDAAGLPIFPGLVRYDEVASGEIRHALRFTAPRTRRAFIWPARHFASKSTDNHLPPLGQRFRLRADFDDSSFPPSVQVVLKALKKYGMFLADNGSPWFLSGAPDERWENEALQELKKVQGSDFQAVDEWSLMIIPNSGRAAEPSGN